MNKKNNTIIIVLIIVIIALILVFIGKNKNDTIQETPEQALERYTQDDSIDAIENNLNNIDAGAATTSPGFEALDIDIDSL